MNYQNQDNFNRYQEPISQREQISSNRPFTNQTQRDQISSNRPFNNQTMNGSPGYNGGSTPVVISFDDDHQTKRFGPSKTVNNNSYNPGYSPNKQSNL